MAASLSTLSTAPGGKALMKLLERGEGKENCSFFTEAIKLTESVTRLTTEESRNRVAADDYNSLKDSKKTQPVIYQTEESHTDGDSILLGSSRSF